MAEHYARRPGTGRGRALRDALIPALLGVAEAEGITIHGTAATRGLARRYVEQLPGTVDIGRGPIRGRRLRRVPSPR